MNRSTQSQTDRQLTIGTCATLACLWEVTAAKPGNVYRGADFDHETFADFATGAAVVGPILDRSAELGVGQAVLSAVTATQRAVATNTNLGTLLLLAPLAAVPRAVSLSTGIATVLDDLDQHDTHLVYQAIRTAGAGGLGTVAEADVASDPPGRLKLVDAMRLAADRDLVAKQYTNRFEEVLRFAAPSISAGMACGWSLETSIVHAQLELMAALPDSLIARKCGWETARRVSDHAAHVLGLGQPGSEPYRQALADLDFWLRADDHGRNPGTTADLLAAALFALLREDRLPWPIRFYEELHG